MQSSTLKSIQEAYFGFQEFSKDEMKKGSLRFGLPGHTAREIILWNKPAIIVFANGEQGPEIHDLQLQEIENEKIVSHKSYFFRKEFILAAAEELGIKAQNIVLTDIQELVTQIDKEQYLNKLEAQSKKSKQSLQKQLEKIDKQLEIVKGRKRKYINMLAEEIITQEEYRENVEANNIEINELVEKKNVLLTAMESEQTVDNIEKLKQ